MTHPSRRNILKAIASAVSAAAAAQVSPIAKAMEGVAAQPVSSGPLAGFGDFVLAKVLKDKHWQSGRELMAKMDQDLWKTPLIRSKPVSWLGKPYKINPFTAPD